MLIHSGWFKAKQNKIWTNLRLARLTQCWYCSRPKPHSTPYSRIPYHTHPTCGPIIIASPPPLLSLPAATIAISFLLLVQSASMRRAAGGGGGLGGQQVVAAGLVARRSSELRRGGLTVAGWRRRPCKQARHRPADGELPWGTSSRLHLGEIWVGCCGQGIAGRGGDDDELPAASARREVEGVGFCFFSFFPFLQFFLKNLLVFFY
jgi:hypothetical protein